MEGDSEFASHLVREYSILIQNTHNVHIFRVGSWVLGEMAADTIHDLESVEEIAKLLMVLGSKAKDRAIDWVVMAVAKLAQKEGFRKHEEVRDFLLELECCKNIRTHNIAEGTYSFNVESIRLAKFGSALKNAKTLIADKNP